MDKTRPSAPAPEVDYTQGGHPQNAYASLGVYAPQVYNPPPPPYQPPLVYQMRPEHSPLSPPQLVYGAPQAPYVPPRHYGWCEDYRRNRPQQSSLAAAHFIFASGGMSLIWSFIFTTDYFVPTKAERIHMQICWFIAVIIGASIAAALIKKVTKRVFNVVASILVIANGIIFLTGPDSVATIFLARYCDGIAFGLTVIAANVAGSEQSVKRFRGLILSTEQVSLTAGMLFYAHIAPSTEGHGIIALIYGTLALVLTLFLTIESPVYHLSQENEAAAIIAQCRLQRPTVTNEAYSLLNEHKHLLQEDYTRGRAMNISASWAPMAKICLFRAFVSLSFSLPIIWTFNQAAGLSNRANHVDAMKLYFPVTMRLVGALFAHYTLDTIGRKGLSAISLLVGGGLMIGVGSEFQDLQQLETLPTLIRMLLGYQLLAGVSAAASTCYLGEAFSISMKPYFILVAVIIENSVQIILIYLFPLSLQSAVDFAYSLGALQIAFGVFFFFGMPETKQTTLREALAAFKKPENGGIHP